MVVQSRQAPAGACLFTRTPNFAEVAILNLTGTRTTHAHSQTFGGVGKKRGRRMIFHTKFKLEYTDIHVKKTYIKIIDENVSCLWF
jgi:hypothetical protein